MPRYLLIGLVCAIFWACIEPHLYAACFYVRYRLFFGAKVKERRPPKEAGALQIFLSGGVFALIICFWPVYLVATATKFLSLAFGRERLTHS